jgi:hypothetical protein
MFSCGVGIPPAQRFEIILMKKNIIALRIFLGSILYAVIWTIILYFAFNYREIRTYEGFLLFIIMFICFYFFGVYFTSVLFKSYSRRTEYILPVAISTGSVIIGSAIFLFLLFMMYLGVINTFFFGILLLLSQWVIIRAGCTVKNNQDIFLTVDIRKIATVLLISLTLLLFVCNTDFPGVNAPVEVRQKWAYEKFMHYPGIVNSIKENNHIIDKVGSIRFVAPTKGRNLHVYLGASSGPTSELTLEVVGEKGTGIAYLTTWMGGIHGFCFEYQGKKTKLWGSQRSCNAHFR